MQVDLFLLLRLLLLVVCFTDCLITIGSGFQDMVVCFIMLFLLVLVSRTLLLLLSLLLLLFLALHVLEKMFGYGALNLNISQSLQSLLLNS